MGDEIPMKKIIILPILAGILSANTNTHLETLVSEYKNMFQKIGEKREGVDERQIDALKSPFVTVEKKKKASETPKEERIDKGFVLEAIINKRAKISGKWYKVQDEVHGMKIISVRDNYVWLKNDEFRKKLILGIKNEKISIK
jgi:hypothetical protein